MIGGGAHRGPEEEDTGAGRSTQEVRGGEHRRAGRSTQGARGGGHEGPEAEDMGDSRGLFIHYKHFPKMGLW